MKANFILLIVSVLLGSCTTRPQFVPTPDHVVVVIMENHGYDQIIGSDSAPYINSLAADSHAALFTHSLAIEHPSQGNYLYLFSGCRQNVIKDQTPTCLPFTTPNLGAELLHSGRTFTGYSEDLQSVGYTGDTFRNYARKHNPWVNWQGDSTNGIPAELNQPFDSFPPNYSSLPTLSFVIPNLLDDMHGNDAGSTPGPENGDRWLRDNLDGYIQWAKTHNSLLILTFDEDQGEGDDKPTPITTIFIGQMVKAGKYCEVIDHNRVLRTMEDMYHLPYAGRSKDCKSITDCWITKK